MAANLDRNLSTITRGEYLKYFESIQFLVWLFEPGFLKDLTFTSDVSSHSESSSIVVGTSAGGQTQQHSIILSANFQNSRRVNEMFVDWVKRLVNECIQ